MLLRVAQDADENGGRVQIAGHVDIVDGDEAGLAHLKFPPDSLADFALEQLAHALESNGRHFDGKFKLK